MLQLVVLIIILMSSVALSQKTVTVETQLGNVTGLSQSITIGAKLYHFNEFRRIPFAKPPIGNLRFQKPVKYGVWNNTLNATYFGPACYQEPPAAIENEFIPNKTLSEDCLFLNIYVPTEISTSDKKSVMIWIHGGSFLTGTGMLYNGAYLATIGDVIVVTVNYRLGVFGFFSTGTDNAKGNYGIWDQKMAIEWVHDNIDAFGGDVDSVTIFGESAGGFSVALQSIIPENRGLFSRVIAQSGVATSFVSTQFNLTYYSNIVAKALKCNSSQESEELICLKQKSAVEIQNVYHYLSTIPPSDPHVFLTFAPIVDGELFTDLPKNILSNESSEGYRFFRSLDVIIGNVDSEGSLLVPTLEKFQKSYKFDIEVGIPRKVLCDHLIPTMVADFFNNSQGLASAVCKEYVNSLGIYKSMDSIDYFSDLYFFSRSVDTLNIHSDRTTTAKTFQYLSKKRTILSRRTPLWLKGSSHASELPLLFPFYNFVSNKSENYELSVNMMRYWTNFAKQGNPNGDNLPQWPEYTTDNKNYQILDVSIETAKDLFKDRIDFWLKDVPNLINTTNKKPSFYLNQGPNNGCVANSCSIFYGTLFYILHWMYVHIFSL